MHYQKLAGPWSDHSIVQSPSHPSVRPQCVLSDINYASLKPSFEQSHKSKDCSTDDLQSHKPSRQEDEASEVKSEMLTTPSTQCS